VKYTVIKKLAELPRRDGHHTIRMHSFCSAYYPTYAAAARRFRELAQQEPGNVYAYIAPTQLGGSAVTTWYFQMESQNEAQ
jgi:hypothetical protein